MTGGRFSPEGSGGLRPQWPRHGGWPRGAPASTPVPVAGLWASPMPPAESESAPPPGSARGPWLTPRTRGRALRAPPLSSCSRRSPAPTWPHRPLIRSRDRAGQRGGVGIRFTPGGSERQVRPRATAHGGSLEAGPSTALRLPGAGRGHWPGHPRPRVPTCCPSPAFAVVCGTVADSGRVGVAGCCVYCSLWVRGWPQNCVE